MWSGDVLLGDKNSSPSILSYLLHLKIIIIIMGRTGNVYLVRWSKVRNIDQQLACLLSLLISQAYSVVWTYLSNTAWEESYLGHCDIWKLWPCEKGLVATLFHHPDTPYSQALPRPLILGELMFTFWIWKNIFSSLQNKVSVMMDMMVLNYNYNLYWN